MAPSRPPGPNDLLLFEKWLGTTHWLLSRTQRFPKSYRHSLTDRVEALAIGILEDITSAAYRKDSKSELWSANDKLNRLRVLVRLAHEMKVLSHSHYQEAAERLSEGGRLLGGWMRQKR